MSENLPVSHIAALENLDYDHAYKLVRGIDPDYKPPRAVGPKPQRDISQSRRVRSRLAEMLYHLKLQHSPTTLAVLIGLKPKEQRKAVDRPFEFDWSLSQMQAVACECGLELEDVFCSTPISSLLSNCTRPAA